MTVIETTSQTSAPPAIVKAGVLALLAIWAAGAFTLGYLGAFKAGPDEVPTAMLIAAVAPPVSFVLAYAMSARLREWVAGLDLGLLTGLQGWRVIGGSFLFLYAFGQLPALFAFPAGVGDVAVGLAAPFAVLAFMHKSVGWRGRVFWLHVAGMIDFAVAIATGLLTSPTVVGLLAGDVVTLADQFPLSLFPTFMVPVFMILHIMSFIKLRSER